MAKESGQDTSNAGKTSKEEILELVEEGLEISKHPFLKTDNVRHMLEQRDIELSRSRILDYLHELEEEGEIVKADVTDKAYIWYIDE